MASFQPRLVTLVPIATFRPSQTPKLWTFDDMDDMVELQDDLELYQAGSQVSRLDTQAVLCSAAAYDTAAAILLCRFFRSSAK